MATMLFDRIVPAGKNAYFPFQLSAAGLNPLATVYVANDATGADSTLQSGVSVDDMGGGLYALKVAAGNMSADGVYYGTVVAGDEFARIPLWAFAPTKHIAEVLVELQNADDAIAAMQGDVSAIKTEIGDVSAASWTGLVSAPADVAAALSAIFAKAKGVQDDLDNATDGLGALKSLIETVDTVVDANKALLENATYGLSALKTEIDANETKIDGVKTVVDANKALLEHQTFGLSALKAEIDANEDKIDIVDANVDTIKSAVENGTYGLSALKTLIDTETGAIDTALSAMQSNVTDILGDTNELQQDWTNGGRLDALLDRTVAASEASEDLIGLATDLSSASTLFGKNAKLAEDVSVVDGNVDAIKTAVESGTYGLEAIKNKADAVGTTADAIQTEIGDVSAEFGVGGPTSVAAALHKIYQDMAAGDVWNDAMGSYASGSSGYELHESFSMLGNATYGLSALSTRLGTPAGATFAADLAAIKTETASIQSDTNDIQTKIGSPTISIAADIAAVKAVVDTLQIQVNAALVPVVPSRIYSKATTFRFGLGLTVKDGKTGALENPDVQGTSPEGMVFMRAKNVALPGALELYAQESGGSQLSPADSAAVPALNGWLVMPQVVKSGTPVVGSFYAYVSIPAYHRDTIVFDFQCKDSDPSSAPATFMSSCTMEVMSPVGNFGGAF